MVYAQDRDKIAWDDTVNKNWRADFKEVSIPSSVDGKVQKAFFYASLSNEKRPLIVSFHTWSGDYGQQDPISNQVADRGFNYIHPDFRGANNTPEACGSEFVISDIEDAIQYAIANSNVDETEVHLVGVSGGGYATLLSYMNVKFPVKSFSAWVPISSLENWYWESLGRQQHYYEDILKATSSDKQLNTAEARRRSPLYQVYHPEWRKNSQLFIYAGIHDGYQGSVPITQSLDMFNKIAKEAFGASESELVSDKDQLELLTKRCFPSHNFDMMLGDRKVHYFKKKENVSVTIFEGKHEQVVEQTIPLLPIDKKYELKRKKILNIGDSNSSFEYSWSRLLSKQHPEYEIINYAIPGNTIGFDNLGQKHLNTLANIDSVLTRIETLYPSIDYVVISLGTNDCKAIFDKRQHESFRNFDTLITRLKSRKITHESKIIVLSVPPADESKVSEKYSGINARIAKLNAYYKKQVKGKSNIVFADTYSLLHSHISEYTTDGIHLDQNAQQLVANKLREVICIGQ